MKSNRTQGSELAGKRVRLKDGREGTVTHGGYGMVSVQLSGAHWYCCPVREVKEIIQCQS